MMPHANDAGATAVWPEPDPEPLAVWTRSDDKLLEMLIARYFPRRDWDVIASHLVGKTPEQASRRYERTVDEVTRAVHALQVETPREWDMQIVVAASSPAEREVTVAPAPEEEVAAGAVTEKARVLATSSATDGDTSELGAVKKTGGKRRKKPEKWTEEEHNLFLQGLEKYGEGKWKAMASEYLPTKTAIQIASHNQKHRKRLEQRKRGGCKRASIHDITQPTSSADGGEPAAQKDGLGRETDRSNAPDEPVGALEEFPGQFDLGTLFM